jgi:uncharacterized membrane protein YedE/YeeE
MTVMIILLGFAFGFALQYSKVNTYNTISGMAILEDYTVAKTIATAIGIGAMILIVLIGLGFASYHIKPFVVGSIIIGGLIFGIGMAILGYCPGTMPVSLGQGSLDALWGLMGGLIASLVYTVLSPKIHNVLGPDLGQLSITNVTSLPVLQYLVVFTIAVTFIGVAFWLNKIEKKKDLKWFYSALLIAVVAATIFTVSDRVLGASSFYPYLADNIIGITDNDYYRQTEKSGNYEMKFLLGAFLSGLFLSLVKGEFKLRLIHENWARFKGNSKAKRIVWALVGGFLLLFGARLANGCTSGHIISGGMQMAVSSLVFAAFVFVGFLTTGKLFYKNSSRSR